MRVRNARARLDAARAALRALSLPARAEALDHALALLASPHTRARAELERALCPEMSQVQTLVAALRAPSERAMSVELRAALPVFDNLRRTKRARAGGASRAARANKESRAAHAAGTPVAAHADEVAQSARAGEALHATHADEVTLGAHAGDASDAARAVDAEILARAEETLRAAHIHPATLRAGLDCAFEAWRAGGGLRALAEAQLDPRRARDERSARDARDADAPGFACTAILCGGALPMPGLETTLDALLLGSPVLLRPSARDAWSAHALNIALTEAHPALGDALEIVKFLNPEALHENFENSFAPDHHADARAEHEQWVRFENTGERGARAQDAAHARAEFQAFCETECVVAYGGDETMQRIAKQRAQRASHTVLYGHKFSVAVVARGAERTAAPALARDVCLWDQLGCLSPVQVWALGDADALADALAAAFEERAKVWPRGALPPRAAAEFARARTEVEMRAANGRARWLGGASWLVTREADARFRGSPLHRALPVSPAQSLAEMRDALAPFARWLSSIGHAGFADAETRALRKACAKLGTPRLAPLGQLQSPPLTWRHDGAGALLPLLENPTPHERKLGESVGL